MTRTWTLSLVSAASIITGITLAAHGDAIDQAGQQGSGWMTAGVLLILIPVLIAGGAFVIWLLREAGKDARKYSAWKQTLTPEQRLGVKAAETAALFATWAVVHHEVKESNARSATRYQERTAAGRASIEAHKQAVQDRTASFQ